MILSIENNCYILSSILQRVLIVLESEYSSFVPVAKARNVSFTY